jgi:hypothetical protein
MERAMADNDVEKATAVLKAVAPEFAQLTQDFLSKKGRNISPAFMNGLTRIRGC